MNVNKIVIMIFLSVLVVPAFGSDAETTVTFGPTLMFFDYAEYDQSGVFLDGEKGFLPGIAGSYRTKTSKTGFVALDVRFYFGEVDYDGQTQAGIPITSTSDTIIFDGNVAIGRQFTTATGNPYDLYTGIGYRYWRREINPTFTSGGAPVAGLLEFYDWWYLMVGTKLNLSQSDNRNVGLDFRVTYMQSANIEVDFLGFGNYDNKDLTLGDRLGFYIGLPIEVKSSATSWVIEPYFEYIDIGRSNVGQVTSGGVPTGLFIVEPRSETRNFGVNIRFVLGN